MGFFQFFVDGIDWKSTLFGAVAGSLVSLLIPVLKKLFWPSRQEFHISLLKRGEEKCLSSVESYGVSIDVKYKGESLKGDFSILEIDLFNDGKKAISFSNHFNRPIYLKSDEYRIIGANTINSSSIGAIVSSKDNGIYSISWDLLKQNEFIRIQLVGQRNTERKKAEKTQSPFYDSLKFNVRSDCVDYLDTRDHSFHFITPFLIALILVLGSLHILLFDSPQPRNQHFRINDEVATGYLVYDKSCDIFILQQEDSLFVNEQLSNDTYPFVDLQTPVFNRTTFLLIVYCSCIVFILILDLCLSLSSKHNEKQKVFEDSSSFLS